MSPHFLFVVETGTSSLSESRQRLRKWFAELSLPLHNWDVVLTELLVNAMNASDACDPIQVSFRLEDAEERCGLVGGRVTCEVANSGRWAIDREPWWTEGESIPIGFLVGRLPNDQLPNGRGLRIVSALTSGGDVRVVNNRTTVRVWREI